MYDFDDDQHWINCINTDIENGFVCDFVLYEAHDFIHFAEKSPTCLSDGHTEYMVCITCDYTAGYEKLLMIDHSYEVCREVDADSHAWYCVNGCDEESVSPHNFVTVAGKHPTSEEAGYTEYEICEDCGFERGKEQLEEVDHVFTIVSDIDYHWNKCACGYETEHAPHLWVGTVCESCEYEQEHSLEHEIELVSDADHHWWKCNECEYVSEKVGHIRVNEGMCEVCKRMPEGWE